MTAPADTERKHGSDQAQPAVQAPWAARAGALVIDIVPAAAVLATALLVALSVPVHGTWWWVCVLTGAFTVLLTAFNRLVLPATNGGQSLGRAVFGVVVLYRDAAAGPWRLLGRDCAHVLDTAAAFVGWLWPLWDSRGRTFADMLLGTEARRIEPRPSARDRRVRAAVVVVLSATALCGAGAALSYGLVGERDRSIADARAQIAGEGPHMVEQLLSYRPETLQDDFDHARALVTDRYLGQLSAQQKAVQTSTPVRNEYWATNSSVLTATPSTATMLVFLQGQRGAPPKQRYITASVRATFVKSASAGWQVDGIEIVTEPQPVRATP